VRTFCRFRIYLAASLPTYLPTYLPAYLPRYPGFIHDPSHPHPYQNPTRSQDPPYHPIPPQHTLTAPRRWAGRSVSLTPPGLIPQPGEFPVPRPHLHPTRRQAGTTELCSPHGYSVSHATLGSRDGGESPGLVPRPHPPMSVSPPRLPCSAVLSCLARLVCLACRAVLACRVVRVMCCHCMCVTATTGLFHPSA
jgi:hypothetical protein